MDRTTTPNHGTPNTQQHAAPAKKTAPRRKAARRSFGTIRQLPSGRWQARWDDQHSRTHTGPHPFETKREAEDWLSTIRADLVRGVWRSPDLGNDTLAAYMDRWLAHRTDLALSTRAGYQRALERWIDRDLLVPAPRGGRPIRINIGEQSLNTLTPATIREWYAAANSTQVRKRAERHERGKVWTVRFRLDVLVSVPIEARSDTPRSSASRFGVLLAWCNETSPDGASGFAFHCICPQGTLGRPNDVLLVCAETHCVERDSEVAEAAGIAGVRRVLHDPV